MLNLSCISTGAKFQQISPIHASQLLAPKKKQDVLD